MPKSKTGIGIMKSIKENIIETLIVLDSDSKIKTVHKTTCELLGYKEEELIGNPVNVVLPATEETLKERKLNDLIKRDELRNYETYLKTKDGKKIPILFNGSVMKDKEGNVDCIVCTARETNGHRFAEEEFRTEKQRFQTLSENAPFGMVMIDKDGTFKYINPKFRELFGYDLNDVPNGKTWFRKAYPDPTDRHHIISDWVNDNNLGSSNTGEKVSRIYAVTCKDGTEKTINFLPVKLETGEYLMSCEDITSQKKAEEALKKSEKEAKRLAQENATMAEIGRIISSTLNIEEVYERFAQEVRKVIPFDRVSVNTMDPDRTSITVAYTFGVEIGDYPAGTNITMEGPFYEDIVNQRSSVLIQPMDENELAGRYSNFISHFKAGIRSMIATPLISKDQLIGILHFQSLKPNAYTELDVRLAERVGNEIAGAIANAQLYAERKQAEEGKAVLQEQLRQSQKMEAIGQLAGGVAHDFNNILTVIHGYSELVINSLDANNPIRDDVKEIKAAADRASALTRQLLAFSRKQVLQLKVLDLNSLVSNMVKMLRRMIGEGIELTTLLADDVGSIKADPGQIEQVILNLAVNAKDAMPKGGKLTVETANVELDQDYADLHLNVVPGSYVMLSVSDTGMGIMPEVRDHILEPFFTTKEKGKGTGLGLSTVYGIVKQSGGNIWIYSEPGQGSTFKIYLPRVEEEVDSMLQSSAVGTKSQQGSETILLVEDEKMVRTLAQTILKRNGYNVLEAENGEEALRVVEEQKGKPINLMLTDLIMPRMNGRELSAHLKPLLPGIKVIYMSGYTDEAVSEHGMLAPGVEYIQKPFPPDALVKKIRSVLDRPR
jgi:two-component system cell cycle sensor histidine kinase/response regulator CckA